MASLFFGVLTRVLTGVETNGKLTVNLAPARLAAMNATEGPTLVPKWIGITVICIVLGMAVREMISAGGSTDRRGYSVALTCDNPDVKMDASSQLAEWIDQNIVNGRVSAKLVVSVAFLANIPSINGNTFVSADGVSSTLNGDPPGTQRCRANFVIAFREADGTLFGGYAPNGFSTEFLLSGGPDGPRITLNDTEMREATLNEASAITSMEGEREQAQLAARPQSTLPHRPFGQPTQQPLRSFGPDENR